MNTNSVHYPTCYHCGSEDVTHMVEANYGPGSIWLPSCSKCAVLGAEAPSRTGGRSGRVMDIKKR